MLRRLGHCFAIATVCGASLIVACGDDDPSAPGGDAGSSIPDGGRVDEHAGQSCAAPAECYPQLDGGALEGDVVCLDRVPNGYCTHECETDADCCAVPGECKTGIKQVCAPFESTNQKLCFLSCETEDITAGAAAYGGVDAGYDGGGDEDAYCKYFATASASCRSTGGGNENRKVCIPKE